MTKIYSKMRRLWLAAVLLAALLAGCGPNSPVNVLLPEPEATPTVGVTPSPTPDNYGIAVVSSPYCPVADWNTIQTKEPQGDLMAWSPEGEMLAWIEPGKTGNWSAGNLVISSGERLEERIQLNIDALAFGSLSWSADGKILAFVALRRSDSLYTVMTVDLSGDRPKIKDRLPDEAARTDEWGSAKAIAGWSGERQVTVISSCGADCDEQITIDLDLGSWKAEPAALRKSLPDYWRIGNHRPVDDPEQYPPMVEEPSWSQDGDFMAYIDERNTLWVINLPDKDQFRIPYHLGYIQEVKWSQNSRKMTVRNESRIFLFSMDCPE